MKDCIRRIFTFNSGVLIFATVLVIYILSSFDICWFFVEENITYNGFVFAPSWREHLHSSEGWAIYNQIQALYEVRPWLSKDLPPAITTDVFKIGDYYYAPFEPLTSFMLLPFYAVGQVFLGKDFLIRSVLIGMIVYTCVNALLARRISLQISQNQTTAVLAAFLFALTTMAFSYSRLLYPQPIICMFTFLTISFIFNYTRNRAPYNLFFASLFFGLTVNSFNAFIITMPFILYFLLKRGVFSKKEDFTIIGLGLIPSILLFTG